MHLKLTLQRGESTDDIRVTVDTTARVGDVAQAISKADPKGHPLRGESGLSLRVDAPGEPRVVPASLTVADAGIQSGQIISVVSVGGSFSSEMAPAAAAATIQVVEGPDSGKEYPLAPGANQVGRSRSSDVLLNDPMVSNRHLRVNVTDCVEVIDLNSVNGSYVSGQRIERAVLSQSDWVRIGETVFKVTHHLGSASVTTGPVVEFNRSPRLDPEYQGRVFPAPEPPAPVENRGFPFIPLVAPVLMGMILYLITRSLVSILFVAMSPLMIVGSFFESRYSGKKQFKEATGEFREALKDLAIQANRAAEEEAAGRRSESPATSEIVGAVRAREPMLWTRRPDRRSFLSMRVGLGTLPARNSIEIPQNVKTTPELRRELFATRDEYLMVENVPVAPALEDVGTLGFAGPRDTTLDLVRSAVIQIVGLHSPAEVVLCAMGSPEASEDWMWLKWLPHATSDHSPLGSIPQLAGSQNGVGRLISALEELIEIRSRNREDRGRPMPAVVVLISDDTPAERSRLVALAESGRGAGVYVIWYSPTVPRLPAACRVYVDNTTSRKSLVGFVEAGEAVALSDIEALDLREAERVSRSMSALKDSGARVHDDSDLPRTVTLLDLIGPEAASSTESIADSWRQTGSLPSETGEKVKPSLSLHSLVGISASDVMALDLRSHGPHALVGGTTGSGKSEFLQSWIMGMAVAHSPKKVTFLFVDYKGGSAFGECVKLPHSVGLVTDLNTHLVRRVLTSLRAELRYREHILVEKKAKDLLELEKRGDPDAPPSLIIVVDEFAALAGEIPEFVDGVVDVAQRGRSLGLHLILATQRPSGVISGSLRANTNLRIALRMADADDSNDVIGSDLAATFDASLPGRAAAKLGHGRLTAFQAAYVGGWTTEGATRGTVGIEELRFGPGSEWEVPTEKIDVSEAERGPNDLARLVRTVAKTADEHRIPVPRIPWQPELAQIYDLGKFRQSRTDVELIFGELDDPSAQEQRPVAFRPDQDGNMAVFGTGGSGKSTVLKTLAIVAGLTNRGGPCHVYGLDFGSRSLDVLETLPHVGSIVNGSDDERVARLLRWLVQEVAIRSEKYANSGSIVDYRKGAKCPDEPRILLLVDNFGAFRQAYEATRKQALFETFQRVVGEGRQVGIHVVLAADRVASVPSSVLASVQRRLVLRAADEQEYSFLGVASDVLDQTSPPGRGLWGDYEVQVALLGGHPNVAVQAAAISALADELGDSWKGPEPIKIGRLSDEVHSSDMPDSIGGLPVLGVADETLEPTPWYPEGCLLVTGSINSGRTETFAGIINSLGRARSGMKAVRFAPAKSRLTELVQFAASYEKPSAVVNAAEELKSHLERGGIKPEKACVVIERASELEMTEAAYALESLVRECLERDVVVLVDSDSASLSVCGPLMQVIAASRHGVAVQPDSLDGDRFFRTEFPPVGSREFPANRALYVRKGALLKVQTAVP